MDERVRFVARLLEGEGMSEVCRDFGISRKTGYKIFGRYKEDGLDALADRSRRPVRYANQLPNQVERLIVDLKRGKPHCGGRAKSANCWCASLPARCACRPKVPCMRCSTATAWSTAPASGATAPKARR
jgi:transposase-like protein